MKTNNILVTAQEWSVKEIMLVVFIRHTIKVDGWGISVDRWLYRKDVVEACCVDGEGKKALRTELWGMITWLGNRMGKKKNVSDVHACRHAGQGTDAMNQQLPECLVSPRGSSLGSLEALGVAHPTKIEKSRDYLLESLL